MDQIVLNSSVLAVGAGFTAANDPEILIREETAADIPAREALLDHAFGEERFAKTCERLREGRLPAQGLALVAEIDGEIVGTIRLWHVSLGPGRRALMLGPLAVAADLTGKGIGARLMRDALARATLLGHRAVILVGDAPYYARFGFSAGPTEALWLPGPYDPARFLALELKPGALAGARGLVTATGEFEARPGWAELLARAQAGAAA